MSLKLGKSEEFWRKELEEPTSKINKLDLLYGAMMYAVNKARQALKGVGETSASISSSLLRRAGSGII